MKGLKVFSELSISRLVILAVFATVAYYYMYYDDGSKLQEQITQARGQLDLEKAKRFEIEKKMKKEEEMRGNLLQLARNLDIVKSKIPNEFNEIEVSTIVNRASNVAQVKLTALKRSATSGASVAPKGAIGADLIEEVTFDIEMSGSFNNIISFVEYLSKEEKTIKIRNFILEKNSSNLLAEETTIKFRGEIVGFKQALAQKAPGAK